jgi:hypothetical protein
MEGYMRLEEGANPKIDLINRMVVKAQSGTGMESNEGLCALLRMFHPMILGICKKWSEYFRDADHHIIHWDDLITDTQYWFYHYTCHVYTINGAATYNNFIKKHIDMRVRYIYESEIRRNESLVHPDPDKVTEDCDNYDYVVHHYNTHMEYGDIDDGMLAEQHDADVHRLLDITLRYLNDERYFTQKERDIFLSCMVNNQTHKMIGDRYHVSRTRVSQIMGKIKTKLYDIMYENPAYWEVF